MKPGSGTDTFLINGGETTLYYRAAGDDGLPLREVFSLLESRRRRCVLYFLSEARADLFDFETVRDGVIEYEKHCERAPEAPDSVTISLEHAHLPRLDKAGVVDWDRDTRTVEYLGHPLVERWLVETRELDLALDE